MTTITTGILSLPDMLETLMLYSVIEFPLAIRLYVFPLIKNNTTALVLEV
jgi:hypothetical protein